MATLVLDSSGRIIAAGANDAGLVAPEGGSLARADDTIHDQIRAVEAKAAGQPIDLTYTDGKVGTRARAKSATETDDDDRRDLAGKLQAALDNWPALTAAQKDALLRVCVRAALRAVR